jgi:hypothetical protein
VDTSDVEVIREEIIVHSTATKRRGNRWSGEASIMGTVKIDGERYSFEKVITVSFVLNPKDAV